VRRILPASLTGRLIVTVVALVAVVSILVSVTATLVMRSFLTGQLDDKVTQSLSRVELRVRGDNGPIPQKPDGDDPPHIGFGQEVGSITASNHNDVMAGIVLTSSRAGNFKPLSTSALAKLADIKPGQSPQEVNLPALGSYRVAAKKTPSGDILWQGLPTHDVDKTISSLIWWESLLALLGVGAAAAGGRVLVRRQLQPLRDVAATAHEVAGMPLSTGEIGETVRVPAELTDPSNEVGQVGEALNQLLGHVEQALDARHESEQQARKFLADASHELRTPLSTIKGYAELSRRTGREDPDQILAKVESEAGRMSSLVEDMLLLARLDAGRELEFQDVDLTRLLVEAINDARVVAPDHQWGFDVPDEPIVISGDEQRLHQAVTNLLTNASRHTPAGTTVTGRLRTDTDNVVLAIHDDGPGIDAEILPTLFDRFTRGDSSRTRASGGAGLGMSLVQAIVHGHRGTATVTSEPGDTTFTLTLPRV
jgi:two-component system OmpR family sensor kinase